MDLIDGDATILEEGPLERAAELGQLAAYKHYGFWRCMDSKRDRDLLTKCMKKVIHHGRSSLLASNLIRLSKVVLRREKKRFWMC